MKHLFCALTEFGDSEIAIIMCASAIFVLVSNPQSTKNVKWVDGK